MDVGLEFDECAWIQSQWGIQEPEQSPNEGSLSVVGSECIYVHTLSDSI